MPRMSLIATSVSLIVRGEEESLATVDGVEVNLFTGKTVFYKAGATASLVRKGNRIAILENVLNPTNIGAIFRSAAAMNMDAVLLTPNCSDPLYRRAARVSMGTVFQVPWTYLDENWIETLKGMGYKTCAMALKDGARLRSGWYNRGKQYA